MGRGINKPEKSYTDKLSAFFSNISMTLFCCCYFNVFLKFILIGVQLLFNAVWVSTVLQGESAIRTHIAPLFWISFPFTSPQSTNRVEIFNTTIFVVVVVERLQNLLYQSPPLPPQPERPQSINKRQGDLPSDWQNHWGHFTVIIANKSLKKCIPRAWRAPSHLLSPALIILKLRGSGTADTHVSSFFKN